MRTKLSSFYLSLKKYTCLSFAHSLLFYFSFLLLLLYPGTNFFFSLQINPGKVYLFPSLLTPRPAPFNTHRFSPPSLSARAVFVFDPDSKTVLYTKNPTLPLPPASLTKILTALVARQHFALTDTLAVSTESATVIGHKINLQPKEVLSFDNLLKSMLIFSANDAALTIADNFPGGHQAFLKELNHFASSLPFSATSLTNPIGLDEPHHLTTARDMALFSYQLVQDKKLARIVQTKKLTITDITGEISHELINTNQLLWTKNIKGIKTGWTPQAKECLSTLYVAGPHRLISVILGSNDRFGETLKLFNWINHNFAWQNPS